MRPLLLLLLFVEFNPSVVVIFLPTVPKSNVSIPPSCWNDNRQYGMTVELIQSLHDCDSNDCLFVCNTRGSSNGRPHLFDCTLCVHVDDCIAPWFACVTEEITFSHSSPLSTLSLPVSPICPPPQPSSFMVLNTLFQFNQSTPSANRL